MAEPSEWRLESGQYLGEISALCFVHLPSNLSSLPYLLAGTGSQIIFYDLAMRNMIRSFQVFEGIRVHGICCAFFDCREESGSFKLAFKVVVFGERRVKLFNLHVEFASESNNRQLACVELILFRSLPKFSHWVLDVCFLKDSVISMQEGNHCLAIGCSDNSVCFWDMLKANVNYEIRCPDKCLLYSMRMWGDKVEALHIASGTIFNEIIVWKVVRQNLAPFFNSPEKDHSLPAGFSDVDLQIHSHQYEAFPVSRLVGHEGSIFQIAWSSNGSKLLSVSDDRSARIWELNAERTSSDNLAEEVVSHSVGSVLFGHSARVWDCCITDYLIITVGEDCTCRVWGFDGIQLKMIKEHIGRGVWRCLYDPNSSLLVTAGFDSAIKVHQLRASLSKGPERIIEVAEEYIDKKEIFTTRIPNSSEHVGLMDSKSEYVRCLQFKNEDTLYVATNKGYLFHAKVSDTGDIKWTELLRVSEEVPIVCMNLLSRNPSDLSCEVEDWVAVGDGKGSVTVVGIVGDIWAPKVGLAYTWSAEIERQLLGTFWCKPLGYRFIFTADPRGTLKLWRLCGPLQSVSHNAMRSHNASLVAEFVSCFALRIMCLDASFQEEVLVCGDLRGNVILFPLLSGLLFETSKPSEAKISPINHFKGAHGISSVCSVSIASSSSSQVEIHSTGGDGCICYLEYGSDQQRLEFIGMKQVNEISLIRSVFYDAKICDDSASGNYAIGFASADFIIWNLITETKVVQIPCGGWRRPHSYYLGDVPEMKNCFAFVKDETIYIQRHWIPGTEKKIYPQNLHLQFHGREIHSLSFIYEDSRFSSSKNQDLISKSSWIATGCEDGTVRLTRYAQGLENWSASKLLGEHVGGSSVRSICSVSKMHIIAADMTSVPSRQKTTLEDLENHFLLISVGSKRVLTAWKQKIRMSNKKEEILAEEPDNPSSMSYQWLSTDMPAKNCSTREKVKREKYVGTIKKLCSVNPDKVSDSLSPENINFDSKICIEDKFENDWRYLAVTAFLVKVADSRVSVCFVVVACSDATVAVRALVLPYRLWFDIAVLVPLASPVLALQHVIISDSIPNLYLVISGCTDGSIGFWDLTENVETFMRRVSSLQMDDYIDCQKRPRTGRGSQGGRWWRSFPKKKSGDVSVSSKTDDSTQNHVTHVTSPNPNHVSRSATVSSHVTDPSEESGARADDFLLEICEIWPLHMLNNVHQSGVNCLHVSDIKDSRCSNSGLMFYVISGGDDQALHCLRFDLTRVLSSHYSDNMTPEMHSIDKLGSLKNSIHYLKKQNYQIRLSFHEKILSAHSSAIKGVWTDGHWVFSTGLDQRVRCWRIEEYAKLTECAHLIVSVPEPEALDARACARNHYQIAVAGRGMQMVEFFAPGDMERESSGL